MGFHPSHASVRVLDVQHEPLDDCARYGCGTWTTCSLTAHRRQRGERLEEEADLRKDRDMRPCEICGTPTQKKKLVRLVVDSHFTNCGEAEFKACPKCVKHYRLTAAKEL